MFVLLFACLFVFQTASCMTDYAPAKRSLKYAVASDDLKEVQKVLAELDEKTLNEPLDQSWPIIAWAVLNHCSREVFQELFKAKANANAKIMNDRFREGDTALHLAIYHAGDYMPDSTRDKFPDIVRILIVDGNADLDATNQFGETPVQYGERIVESHVASTHNESFRNSNRITNIITRVIPAAIKERDARNVKLLGQEL